MADMLKLLFFALACAATASVVQGGVRPYELREQRDVQGEAHHVGSHVPHDGPHKNHNRVRRQSDDNVNDEEHLSSRKELVPCDLTLVPKDSCYDCNTRLKCKTHGGQLKPCDNVLKPYCYYGSCSAIPSPECREDTSTTTEAASTEASTTEAASTEASTTENIPDTDSVTDPEYPNF